MDKKAIVNMLFPFVRLSVWYVTVHISLMLVSPFLDGIKNWNEKKLRTAVLVIFALTSVVSTLKGLQEDYLSWLAWFVFVYVFVIYLKQFILKRMNSLKVFIFLICAVFGYTIIVLIKVFSYEHNLGIYVVLVQWLSDSKSLVDFWISSFVFIYFTKINIGSNKIINYIASNSFSVYVFHQIPAFYMILWNSILKVQIWKNSLYMPLYATVSVVVVYVFGMIINLLYKHLFESILIENRIAQWLIKKIDLLYDYECQ